MFFIKMKCRKVFYCGMLFFLLCGNCFSAEVKRVVSLSPAVTELICHLGRGSVLVARSSVCNYPADVEKLPSAGDFARPDTAKILAFKPDLVISNDLIVPAAAENFRRAGIRFLLIPCRNMTDYCKMTALLGKELNAEKAAAKEIARIEKTLSLFKQQKKLKKRVLALVWHKPAVAAGENTILTELISLAGGENCTFNGVQGYFKAAPKFLLNCGADTLLVFSPVEAYLRHPVLKNLEAVRKKRVIYFENSDVFQRPGPRFFEGVEKLRKALEK